MSLKSREIIFSIQVPDTTGKLFVRDYKLRGINSVSYTLDTTIASSQGLANVFIHPWFLKAVQVSIQGKTYIGNQANLADAMIDFISKKLPDQENPKKENVNVFKWLASAIPNTSLQLKPGKIYRYQEFIGFMNDIVKISDAIQRGEYRPFNTNKIIQVLKIGNYTDEKNNSVELHGYISKVSLSEKSSTLGLIDYTIEFIGALKQTAALNIGEQKGKNVLKKLAPQRFKSEQIDLGDTNV